MKASLSSSATTPLPSCPSDPLQDFNHGVKHDPSLFIEYKDEKHWDLFSRTTLAVARAQMVDHVFASSYHPAWDQAS